MRNNGENGFSLLETVVGLAIIGLVTVGFISGLGYTFKGLIISDKSVTVNSLAESQIEYIKEQDYIASSIYDNNDPLKSYQLVQIPADLAGQGYTVEILQPQQVNTPEVGNFEIQHITVVIDRNGESLLSLSDYRYGYK